MCGIILNVKKFATLTISLCSAAAVALSGTSLAFADGGQTLYPENFEALTLTDYAVCGDKYALAADNKISVFDGNDKPQYFEAAESVTALDCENGIFYYALADGVYSLPDMQKTDRVAPQVQTTVFVSPYTYSLIEGNVAIYSAETGEQKIYGSYSSLKVFDGIVYALESNTLKKINPDATVQTITGEIANFSQTESIKIGSSVEVLKKYSLSAPLFTALTDGEYITEVNLEDLNGENFIVGKTFRVGENEDFPAGKPAMLLARTGNADIILLNGNKTYIKLSKSEPQAATFAEAPFENATVSIVNDYAYSAPYVAECTKLFKINWGDKVKVTGKVVSDSAQGVLYDFYRVVKLDESGNAQKDDGGNEICGYVLAQFLTASPVSDGGEHVTPDPAYTTDDSVKTVVLILVIVALVLIAAGYITYVLTSGRRKKKAEKNQNNQQQN